MSLSKSKRPHKSYTRRQKLLIGLFVFIVVDIALFTFTVTRYNGYDLINSRKYVEFKMPKDKSMSSVDRKSVV